MSNVATYTALNRLLTILYRSLPMYLSYTSPWAHQGEQPALKALQLIVGDELALSKRVAQFIMDHFGPVELGDYPIEYYDTHDLSLDYLLLKLVDCQKSDIHAIEQCLNDLRSDRPAAALAEEALGAARGHLETLEELVASTAK